MIHERVRAWSAFTVVRAGALGVAAVLVLGGCSGDGEPGAEAAEVSSSASPSSGATASASAPSSPTQAPTVAAYKPASAEGPAENVPLPVMPELAKQESKEGLEAFARHWYALVNYGFETGDVTPIQDISGPNCVVCDSFYSMVNNGYRNDDWILGGRIETLGVNSTFVLTGDGFYQVLAHIRQDQLEYRGPENRTYEIDDGVQELTVQMAEAQYLNGQWNAANVVTIK